ncbi:MAG: class I tRNA ligase family protein [Candidatus Paceibacterota bacterium]|jgi:isoleucyl-tRNA synthetase
MADISDSNQTTDKDVQEKTSHAEREERILAFWKEKGIFEKTLNKFTGGGTRADSSNAIGTKSESPKGSFTFYDGPPFATGTPHFGHILAGTIKDVIPRWKTMQGYSVRRRWGWDCHGLPVENLIEKELGLKSKKDIIDYGIGKFNEAARESVMCYADEWRKIIPRLGRWVDMDNDYRTMDATYTESVWWIFKNLYEKGLIYEGFKSMNLCPHCETTLSNFEVAQGYKDITDISVYVKFNLNLSAGGKISNLKNNAQNSDSNIYLLAWTTTPWTLPGNVALAVNPKIDYIKIRITEGDEQKKGQFIFAKERLSALAMTILKDIKYEVIETIHGSKLIGMEYEPLFDYYSKDQSLKNGWKIYGADFVTIEDGTGLVHIAPAFGSDDYEMLKKYGLPFVQHVSTDGKFKKEVIDFADMSVKPKDTDEDKNAHQKADIEVIKWLAHNNRLFDKEKLIHSYPHCWRCNTPLLNYAASSWFVNVPSIKDKLVAENNKVTWVPPEVGSARFGNWLEGARDWAISRSRFWGAPIPVWKEQIESVNNNKGKENYHVIGSVEDLSKYSQAKNTYYVIRHGEADNNVGGFISGEPDAPHHLTVNGKKQVNETAESLKNKHFDLIFVSPFVRTIETANILKEKLDWKQEQIHIDSRIRELDAGVWNGRKVSDFINEFKHEERFDRGPEGGETYSDIKKRVGDFIYDLENKYKGKNILIISHETPIFLLIAVANGLNKKQALDLRSEKELIGNARVLPLNFVPLPHNSDYELDLHRPYIDDLELKTENGNKLIRVPDVFDCWFESGSMPYGEAHYPFEKDADGKSQFDPTSGLFHKSHGYPADFIAEGLDQTRGWFYSMLVLGVALFGKSPFKKVIVNGLVLAEDGEKMSKSKKNFPDPMLIVNKYGADSLRFYLMSSPVVHGEDLCFSEKGVDEITKKVVNRFLNVVSFYEMYEDSAKGKTQNVKIKSENILDKWIITRLNELVSIVTDSLEKGELDRATRPFLDFTDDLSTWYLRRSRDRFKGEDEADKNSALQTTHFVLNEVAKLLAPFMPFLAEDIYLRIGGDKESVHLEEWPVAGKIDTELLNKMKVVRDIASKGLEARMKVKINVRQPLSTLRVKERHILDNNSINLIKDEINIKNVVFGAEIESDIELDTTITPELKEEGDLRELLRKIQDMRKDKGLSVTDMATLIVTEDLREIISKNEEVIKKATKIRKIEFGIAMEIKV